LDITGKGIRLQSLKSPLFIIAGAKGAVGSTIAAAIAALKKDPQVVMPWLTTGHYFEPDYFEAMDFTGWDVSPKSVMQALEYHRVLPSDKFLRHEEYLGTMQIRNAPACELSLPAQIDLLMRDIQDFKSLHPETHPVLVNLLPACPLMELDGCNRLDQLHTQADPRIFPDMAYVLAAISSGVPVVNFTSNAVELPLVVEEAVKKGVPMCGRDGKTGQTYLKVVLASALKARRLKVDGWYSLNILGNEDGRNLADPLRAEGKVANKTGLLDEILGYGVGEQYGTSSHKVVIDYYPPRGDCKEAWDVIDFTGLFGLPMSLRLNLQARDSTLAAPMIIDLALWMAALHTAGRSGLVPELGFYFKKPIGPNPPISFQEQIAELQQLELAFQEINS
jgi:myo-inositol-1-phosphate synthase